MIRNSPTYAGAGPLPLLYLIGAVILALAIGVETYFQNPRWPRFAAGAIVGVTILSLVLMVLTPPLPGARLRASPDDRPAGRRRDARLPPAADADHEHPGRAGAAPGRGVLDLRVHAQEARAAVLARPEPAGRPVPVQPVHRARWRSSSTSSRRCPARSASSLAGRLHSRVPATILIALGAFFPTITDSLNRAGSTELFQLGKFLGVVFLFAGFLVSVEVFREIRIPFTSIRLSTARRDRAARATPSAGRRAPRIARTACRRGAAGARAAAPADGRGCRRAAERPAPADAPPRRRPRPACRGRLCSRRWTGHRRVRGGGGARHGSGCCSWTTTRSCGGACTGSSSSSTTSRSWARPRTGAQAVRAGRASTSPTSC